MQATRAGRPSGICRVTEIRAGREAVDGAREDDVEVQHIGVIARRVRRPGFDRMNLWLDQFWS